MQTNVRYTRHAISRQARRNISDQDLHFVLNYGRHIRCAGALHIFLGRRDIPQDKQTYQRFAHLEGTVVVLDDTQDETVIITTYRNRRGLKDIRSKAKYNRKPHSSCHIDT